MAWLFRGGSVAGGTSPAWVATDKPTAADFNNIAHDIQVWGGNVNAGGNRLINLNGFISTGAPTWNTTGFLTVGSSNGNVLTLNGNGATSDWVAFIINQTSGGWGLFDQAAKSYISTSLVIGTPPGTPNPPAAAAAAPLYVHIFTNVNFALFNTSGATTLSAFTDVVATLCPMQFNATRYFFNLGFVGIGAGANPPQYLLHLGTDSAGKPGGGSWTNSSDARLKKDVRPFQDGLATILQVNPVHYTYNGKGGCPEGYQGIGVIAQDVQKAVPYCVSTQRTKLQEGDAEETDLLAFNGSALLFVLINAVKELAKRLPPPKE